MNIQNNPELNASLSNVRRELFGITFLGGQPQVDFIDTIFDGDEERVVGFRKRQLFRNLTATMVQAALTSGVIPDIRVLVSKTDDEGLIRSSGDYVLSSEYVAHSDDPREPMDIEDQVAVIANVQNILNT